MSTDIARAAAALIDRTAVRRGLPSVIEDAATAARVASMVRPSGSSAQRLKAAA